MNPSLDITLRVGVIEDADPVRESLASLLEHAPGFALAGAWASGELALLGLPSAQPDVVLMDIQLPGMSGVECVRRVRGLLPATRIMMLTLLTDPLLLYESIKAGATGYLAKQDITPERLLDEIRALHRGGSPMSPSIARWMMEDFKKYHGMMEADFAKLSVREEEVIRRLAQGSRCKEIALAFGISPDTVRTHLRNIYEKLQVNSKAEAIRRCRERYGPRGE